jgi:hypothetical protein
VLVSVLVGVELFGILGALLAIPAAGVMQVVIRDLWDHRTGKPKEEATIGEDQTPVSEVIAERKAEDAADQADADADTNRADDDDDEEPDELPPPAAVDEERPVPVPE